MQKTMQEKLEVTVFSNYRNFCYPTVQPEPGWVVGRKGACLSGWGLWGWVGMWRLEGGGGVGGVGVEGGDGTGGDGGERGPVCQDTPKINLPYLNRIC